MVYENIKNYYKCIVVYKKEKKKIPDSAIINLTSHVDKHSVIGKCCYIGKMYI